MNKKTLGEELSEAGAEFILIFLVLAVVLSPYIIGGIIGGIIAIILVVGIVILYIAAAIDTKRRKRKEKKEFETKTNIQINPTNKMVKSHNDLERKWKHCPYCGVKIPAAIKTCYYCKNKGKNK